MRDKLIESLESMETCTKIVEVESKSWHDFWVVHRALVRSMWLVLTWIIKQIDKKGIENEKMKTGILKNEVSEPNETEHIYKELDKIRLVYEDLGSGMPELVGWYNPNKADME